MILNAVICQRHTWRGAYDKALPNKSQKQSKAVHNSEGLWERIQQALGTSGVPETARVMGLTKPSVYDWQKGKMPGLDTLVKIARVANVSLHWLITGEGSRSVFPSQESASVFEHLRKTEREIVQRLADEEGHSLQEEMSELIAEALIARGLVPDQQKAITDILRAVEQTPRSRRHLLLLRLLQELSSATYKNS